MATKAKLTLSQFLFRRTSSSSSTSSSNSSSSSNQTQNPSSVNNYQSCSNNNNVNTTNNANITNNNNLEVGKYEQFADFQEQLHLVNKVYPPKKVQANFATVSAASGRHGLYEIQNHPENMHRKTSETNLASQQQLHGILKRGGKNDGHGDNLFRSAAVGGKTTRSSLHRSRSNPNPNNNPLKEVSWSCPTLEKRREVILNYFERIILENKQEQNGHQNKPNIPCEGNNGTGPSGEPIYEEISDRTSSNTTFAHPNTGERTGSLKPKVMPKKVRMNIPQDQEKKECPIYDKVLCRSHSMIEPSTSLTSSYYSGGNSGYYDILPSNTSSSSETHSFYENYAPYSTATSSSASTSSAGSDYADSHNVGARNKSITTTRIAARSHSFHDSYRSTSHTGSHNIQCNSSIDMDQMYAKVCKRKKMKAENNESEQLSYIHHDREDDKTTYSVQVSCGNGVTTIPVIMPCSSSFSTSCLSLSSSSDNNNDDAISTTTTSTMTTIRRNDEHDHDNDSNNGLTHYYSSEKIHPDKDIAYVNNGGESQRNRNNLSVIHLLASYDPTREIEEFIPTTPAPSFTAIIDSTESAPKSISVPVRAAGLNNSNPNNNNYTSEGEVGREEDQARYLYPPTIASVHRRQQEHQKPLMVTNCSYGYDVDDYEEDKDHEKLSSTYCSSATSCTDGEADDDEDDHDGGEVEDDETKYRFPDGVGGVTLLKKITFKDDPTELILLTSDSEDEEICEHKSLIDMTTNILDESGHGTTSEKYLAMMEDEEREFDSFLDENEGSSSPENKRDSPFTTDNLREQRTFSQSQQNVPPEALKKKAESVLDLINSEISDLHMRELELKKIHSPPPPSSEKSNKLIRNQDGEEFYGEEGSSGEDDFSDSAIEYDGFTTNGSHSSGQVSPSDNLNEMTSQLPQDEPEQTLIATIAESNPEDKQSPLNDEARFEGDEVDLDANSSRHKVRPLEEEEEDRRIKFSDNGETPIEREIKLIREREEEFKKLNNLKKTSPSPTPAQKTASLPPTMKSKPVFNRPNKPADLPSLPHSVAATGPKDAQYEMATARFKREIEESMQREKELMIESRFKRGVSADGDNVAVTHDETPNQDEVKSSVEEEPQTTTPPVPQESKPQPVPLGPENVLRKPTLVKLPINKLPAARFFSPPAYNGNKPNRITPVVSPIRGGGSLAFPSNGGNITPGGSLPIGINKPSFTSMEKYMLHYMSSKAATVAEEPPKVVAEVPAPVKQQPLPITEDPLRIVRKLSMNEEEVEEEKEEDEKPKRRYVPAQDKIHKEIQELVMREKELTTSRAKWKSTLDLPEAMKETENAEDISKSTLSLVGSSLISKGKISPTAAAVANESDNEKMNNGHSHADSDEDFRRVAEDVREVTRVRAPARRRHSLLINQWEERIRQQQQINNKK